jgi:hypothetical protein
VRERSAVLISSYSGCSPVAFFEYTRVSSTDTSNTPPVETMSFISDSFASNSSSNRSVRPTALGA